MIWIIIGVVILVSLSFVPCWRHEWHVDEEDEWWYVCKKCGKRISANDWNY